MKKISSKVLLAATLSVTASTMVQSTYTGAVFDNFFNRIKARNYKGIVYSIGAILGGALGFRTTGPFLGVVMGSAGAVHSLEGALLGVATGYIVGTVGTGILLGDLLSSAYMNNSKRTDPNCLEVKKETNKEIQTISEDIGKTKMKKETNNEAEIAPVSTNITEKEEEPNNKIEVASGNAGKIKKEEKFKEEGKNNDSKFVYVDENIKGNERKENQDTIK